MIEQLGAVVSPRTVTYSSEFRKTLSEQLARMGDGNGGSVVYFVDSHFSQQKGFAESLPQSSQASVLFTPSGEPSTDGINSFASRVKALFPTLRCIVGIGGGSTLDTAKAVSMTLTNGGKAEDLQGWDRPSTPGIRKIGIPSLIGTGAEASRTAVLVNSKTSVKLGINSNYTTFDSVIFDRELSDSVPRDLVSITLTDAYLHASEILTGRARNAFSDSCAEVSLNAFRRNLESTDPQEFFQNSIVASYFGGIALSGGLVGLVHPLSAALGTIFSLPHTTANLCALAGLQDFYPAQFEEISIFLQSRNVKYPSIATSNNVQESRREIMRLTLVHEKPLQNFLGPDYLEILSEAAFTQILEQV